VRRKARGTIRLTSRRGMRDAPGYGAVGAAGAAPMWFEMFLDGEAG
jgi:hypothetical protein